MKRVEKTMGKGEKGTATLKPQTKGREKEGTRRDVEEKEN